MMSQHDSLPPASRHRGGWRFYGQRRPPFAVDPRPGEESVWDYPRPPRIEPDAREVVVRAGGADIARTRRALRVLETASPPTFYIPRADIATGYLQPSSDSSGCEWKGPARYWAVLVSSLRLERAGWSYEDPLPGFESIQGHLSFYPGRVECYVDGIRVKAQPGGFYGGWVTPDVVGPFKGEPGTGGW